jgi:hypothetical protein
MPPNKLKDVDQSWWKTFYSIFVIVRDVLTESLEEPVDFSFRVVCKMINRLA